MLAGRGTHHHRAFSERVTVLGHGAKLEAKFLNHVSIIQKRQLFYPKSNQTCARQPAIPTAKDEYLRQVSFEII